MKILKIGEHKNYKDHNPINLSMLMLDNNERKELDYFQSKDEAEKNLYKRLSELFSEEELNKCFNILSDTQYAYKNTSNFYSELKEFFEDEVIQGQEDVMAMIVNIEKNAILKIRASDFGIAISYSNDNLNQNKITIEDKDDIIETMELLSLLINQPEEAMTIKEKIIMQGQVEKNAKKSAIKKF